MAAVEKIKTEVLVEKMKKGQGALLCPPIVAYIPLPTEDSLLTFLYLPGPGENSMCHLIQ